MRRIAVEEHLLTESLVKYLRSRKVPPRLEAFQDQNNKVVDRMYRSSVNFTTPPIRKLTEVGPERIAIMDKAGIDMQVLSVASPGPDELEASEGTAIAPKLNDELSAIVKRYPDRFAGLACVAPANPVEAARELERAVKQLGLRGAKINSHGRGEYLDDPKYRVFWAKLEELGVPLYIHPKEPPEYQLKAYAKYPELVGPIWGFGADTGFHAMRLIFSGLFDAYPKLTVILGHLGEAIPFWLWRIDNHAENILHRTTFKRKPSEYFKGNFYASTSGMFWEDALAFTCKAMGADRVMFAVDYPYEDSNKEAVEFVEKTDISDADKEKIFHLNAEKALNLS